jgi:hypothetical protein
MSKIIRRTVKKRGAALIVALQLTALTFISLISFVGGPQQSTAAPALPIGEMAYDQSPIDHPSDMAEGGRF